MVSMEDLLQAMQVVDKNADVLSEGDYLELCNHLKEAYNKKSKPATFFNYDAFSLELPVDNEDVRSHFIDHFHDRAVELDIDFIQGQIQYLEKEMKYYDTIARATKDIKRTVRDQYCFIHGIDQEHFSVIIKTSEFKKMCASYIASENIFREKYREALLTKILWLEESLDAL